jgi:hypothetical protein
VKKLFAGKTTKCNNKVFFFTQVAQACYRSVLEMEVTPEPNKCCFVSRGYLNDSRRRQDDLACCSLKEQYKLRQWY